MKTILPILIIFASISVGCVSSPRNATNYIRDLRGKNVEGTFTSNSLWGGTTFNFKAEELGSSVSADEITYNRKVEADENTD